MSVASIGSDLECRADAPGRAGWAMVGVKPGEDEDDEGDMTFDVRGDVDRGTPSLIVTAEGVLLPDVFGSGRICD